MKKKRDNVDLTKDAVRLKVGDPVRLRVKFDGFSVAGDCAPYARDSTGVVASVEPRSQFILVCMDERGHRICILKTHIVLCENRG